MDAVVVTTAVVLVVGVVVVVVLDQGDTICDCFNLESIQSLNGTLTP